MDGLDQLSRWIAVDGEEAQKLQYKKASKNVVRSMRLKLLQILNDLLLNDSSITKTNLSKRNDYVKKYLMADTRLMDHLIGLIGPDVDLSVTKDGVVRSQYVLNILFRLYEDNNSTDDRNMFVKMARAVQNHKERLIDYMSHGFPFGGQLPSHRRFASSRPACQDQRRGTLEERTSCGEGCS